ncbi:MAG: hypothetical protein ACKN8Y_11125, partial [Polynucleobacter victoriensis]
MGDAPVMQARRHQYPNRRHHPLAGLALKFWLVIADVREATEEELEDGHPKGAFGLNVEDEDDDDDLDIDDGAPASPEHRPT